MTISQSIQLAYKAKGYKFFPSGEYNLNIFGIRNATREAGKFDDKIGVMYLDDSKQAHVHLWSATTDPGIHWLRNPLNKNGTAIMVKGQYRGAYKLGIHGRTWASGGYKALEQVRPMQYVRDNNQDDVLDFNLAESKAYQTMPMYNYWKGWWAENPRNPVEEVIVSSGNSVTA